MTEIIKLIWRPKEPRIAKTILKEILERLAVLYIETYQKT